MSKNVKIESEIHARLKALSLVKKMKIEEVSNAILTRGISGEVKNLSEREKKLFHAYYSQHDKN